MTETISFQYPKNYSEKDRDIFYFIDTNEVVPDPEIQYLQNVSIHIANGTLLLKWRAKDVLKKVMAFAGVRYKIVKEAQPVIWFSIPHKYNYFHWFNDTLPSLMLLEQKGIKGKIMLNENLISYKFIHETLDLLGWEYEFYCADKIVVCKNLFIPGSTAPPGSQHPVYFKALINRFIEAAGCKPVIPFRNIFISRKGNLDRKVEPAIEVESILKDIGFEALSTDRLSLKEQVQFFWQCKELMSAHGGGLTNMAFMQKGSKIIEIKRNDDNLNFCFFKMANICQHDYYYLLGKGKYGYPDVLHDDYIIDQDELKKVVSG